MVYVSLVAIIFIWATWDLLKYWVQAKWPEPLIPEPQHCCACQQWDRKCDAMENGVQFYVGPVEGSENQ